MQASPDHLDFEHAPSLATLAGSPPTGREKITHGEVAALFARPLMDLLLEAQTVTRQHFEPNTIQLSTLVSIKTGGCPEDCGYCPQAARYHTDVPTQPMMALAEVVAAAKAAQANGATRFCMGAAWRSPKDHQIASVAECVSAVKALGMETCVTLGMLKSGQAESLAHSGLDYYNHNLDTSPSFYGQVISTRTYRDRLDTLERVRDAGLKVCCGGIIGMGETAQDRAGLLVQLANLDPHPESVPINELVRVAGTPLSDSEALDPLEFVRTIAVARLLMPTAYVRLSAGRQTMSNSTQALCFMAGANSIFYGEKLLTTDNPEWCADESLFTRLGLRKHTLPQPSSQPSPLEA